mmetsp:Transcript_15986/g.46629  ORF Transcript_15986/g.46629 Transcript_15986/m.46629 type:complete len:117 (+) Transcript_15986:1-351(+)
MLQQAGLLQAAIHFHARPSEEESCGEAVVTFLSYFMAGHCISHFQGRQWNSSGGEVAAWLEPHDSAAPGEWATCGYAAEADEWRKRCDSGNSTEASTEVGPPSELEEEREGEVAIS